MHQLICKLLDHYSLKCMTFPYVTVDLQFVRSILYMFLNIPYVPVDMHCVRWVRFILFGISICTGWYALCSMGTVYSVWHFHMHRLICTVLEHCSLYCLRNPHALINMPCVRKVLFILSDISICTVWYALC